MAQITKRVGKNGAVSYLIRVSDGYGVDGRQRKKSMTWTPPEGTTPKKIDKQLQIEALKFEERVNAGTSQDGSIRFQSFAEKWLSEYAEKQLKRKTVDGYKKELSQIYPAIGHIRLKELRTGHLNSFYANLQETGIRRDTKYACCGDLLEQVKNKGMKKSDVWTAAGLSHGPLEAIFRGEHISKTSAEALSRVLGMKLSELFKAVLRSETLSSNTVRGYHRVISSILAKAVKWGYIPYNPAVNAELPKMEPREAVFLDESDARRLLTLLQTEPVKWRVAITFDLLSGLRRGELLGLRWRDVDFETETITIVQTYSYASTVGLYVDTPKNKSSIRPLKLSRSAFVVLWEYKAWQDEQREACGDYWQDRDDRVFTGDDGTPIHPDALSKWFHDFVKRSGLPPIHVHSLRHTYASLMIADGTPLVVVSRRLGHAQVSTTANIYAHMIASADEKAAQVAEKFADVLMPSEQAATA